MASPPSDDDLLSNPQFAGLFQTLSIDKDDAPSTAEVVDDYEGEQETLDLQNSAGDNGDEDDADDNNSEDGEEDAGDEASVGFSGLKDVVKNASKGITEGTDGEYRRSEHNCPSFLPVADCQCYILAKWPSAFSSWLQRNSSMVVSRSSVQLPVPMHHFSLLHGSWTGM